MLNYSLKERQLSRQTGSLVHSLIYGHAVAQSDKHAVWPIDHQKSDEVNRGEQVVWGKEGRQGWGRTDSLSSFSIDPPLINTEPFALSQGHQGR